MSGGSPAAFPTTSVSPGTQSQEAMGQEGADSTAGHGQPTQAQPVEPAIYLPTAHGLAAGSARRSAPVVATAQHGAPPGKRQKLQHGPASAALSAGAVSAAEVAADSALPAKSAEQGFATPAKQQLGRWPNISQDSPTAVVVCDDDGMLTVMPPASAQPGATQVRVQLNPLVLIS